MELDGIVADAWRWHSKQANERYDDMNDELTSPSCSLILRHSSFIVHLEGTFKSKIENRKSQNPPRFLLYTAECPACDLAIEEAVHTAVEDGLSPNTWRLWQAAGPAVVLGTGLEAAKEVDLEAARAEGIAVLRRHSGGGSRTDRAGRNQLLGFLPSQRPAGRGDHSRRDVRRLKAGCRPAGSLGSAGPRDRAV